MATNQTQYYGLSQWLAEDKVERVDFNADNEKIDAALRALSTGKANSATVTALSNTVAKKAEQADLDALETTVAAKANQTDLAALTTKVNAKAEQSALTSLTTTVNSKANQSALTTLNNTVTSLQTTVTNNATKHTNDMNTLRGENCWTKIGTTTLSANATSMNISIPTAHRGIYRELTLYVKLSSTGSGLLMTVNNLATGYYSTGATSDGSTSHTIVGSNPVQLSAVIHLCDLGLSGGLLIRPEGISVRNGYNTDLDGYKGVCTGVTLSTLSSIQLKSQNSSPITAGSNVILYGLKA